MALMLVCGYTGSMLVVSGIFIFLLGAIVGSFLNVVILRFGTERTLAGRSACPSCGKTLSWGELIPLLSFIVQRGRCRSCQSSISWQYPLVEFLTGILFLGIHLKFFELFPSISYIATAVFYVVVVSLLVVIFVYDYYHKLIPNLFVYTLVLLGAVRLFIVLPSLSVSMPAFWHFFAGPVLFAPFALLWLVSKGTWMGFGDAKLAWAFGWLLGMKDGITAIVLAFWVGALFFLVVLMIQKTLPLLPFNKTFTNSSKQLRMKSEVPFGPFLIIGFLTVFFTGIDILSLVSYVFFI